VRSRLVGVALIEGLGVRKAFLMHSDDGVFLIFRAHEEKATRMENIERIVESMSAILPVDLTR